MALLNPKTKTRSQVLDELETFMKRHQAPRESWYVGTAAAAKAQMFQVHGFTMKDVGLFRQMASDSDAASLAEFLIKRGAKGDGAMKPGASSVYLFKMSATTKPALGK